MPDLRLDQRYHHDHYYPPRGHVTPMLPGGSIGLVFIQFLLMVMLAATTSGAIFFRIYLALWAIFAHGRYFDLFYACDAWIAWALPLGISARFMRQNGTWRSLPA